MGKLMPLTEDHLELDPKRLKKLKKSQRKALQESDFAFPANQSQENMDHGAVPETKDLSGTEVLRQAIAEVDRSGNAKKRKKSFSSEMLEPQPDGSGDVKGVELDLGHANDKARKKDKKKRKKAENNEDSDTLGSVGCDRLEEDQIADLQLNHSVANRNVNGRNKEKKEKKKKKGERNHTLSSISSDSVEGDQNNVLQACRAREAPDNLLKEEISADKKSNEKVLANSNIIENGSLQVNVSGLGCEDGKFRPLKSFEELQVPQNVLDCCKDFEKPSPIQAHTWPFLLHGRDLIGIAATGSGKTLAFGLPALVHVLKRSSKTLKQQHPVCLVLSPTRELAQQIADVLIEAGHSCGVRTACLYGGTSKKPQIAALKSGVAIIVATPGRLQDLMEEGLCHLNDVSYLDPDVDSMLIRTWQSTVSGKRDGCITTSLVLVIGHSPLHIPSAVGVPLEVLDEADRMLDLGFEPAVRAVVSQTSTSRQMLMFSATWPTAVDQLSKEFMQDNPVKVVVGSQDLAANHAVTQIVEVIEHTARDARLIALLQQYHKSERNRVLVFVLYKKEATRVENVLQRRGWKVCAVHGDKGQLDRNKAVMSFKDGTCPLMIATDVAARGLDIPDVEYVINYSFPLTTEDYVHRIGRTGRAGKSGIAHTFFTQADKARSGELVNVLKEAGQTVPSELLKFGTSVKKKESKLYGAHFKEVTADAPKATKITFDSDDE